MHWFYRCSLVCLFWGLHPAFASTQADPRNVLVLSPFEPGWFNAGQLDSGLRSGLQLYQSAPIRVFNENLDLLRFPHPDQQRKLAEYLRLKYSDRKPSLIVCLSLPTLSFLKEFGSVTALQSVPHILLISETEQHLLGSEEAKASSAIVTFDINFTKTLNFALKLQPDTRRVVVVGGASSYDRFWSEQFRQEALCFKNISTEFWNGFAMPDLLFKLKHLPSYTVVLYHTMIQNAAGRSFLEEDAVTQICRAASVPVYGFRRSYMGLGIVGGHLVDLQMTGRVVGEAGADLLKGARLTDVSIRKAGTNQVEVDWEQMQRWHLPEEPLPAYASVQFRTPSAWQLYGWKISILIVLCLVKGALIAGLLVHRSRHNRSAAALHKKSQELRSLAGQLITVQEEERQRIARELHDAFCQQIAVLALSTNEIERSLENVPPSVSEQFTDIENRLTTLSEELRQLSHELYPALLKHAGPAAALKHYCREFTVLTGIEVDLSIDLSQKPVPTPIALCLYRIAQESLNNIAKYAGTDRAYLHLVERKAEYQLTVEDKGNGFDLSQIHKKNGIGLSSMEERVYLLSGKIVIQSQPYAGTKVQVVIPIDEQEEYAAGSPALTQAAFSSNIEAAFSPAENHF